MLKIKFFVGGKFKLRCKRNKWGGGQCFVSGSGFRGLLDPDPYMGSRSGSRGLKKGQKCHIIMLFSDFYKECGRRGEGRGMREEGGRVRNQPIPYHLSIFGNFS